MYVGAIEDTDTSKVKVRKITATEDNSSILALAKKAEESIPNSMGSPVVLEEDDKAVSYTHLDVYKRQE